MTTKQITQCPDFVSTSQIKHRLRSNNSAFIIVTMLQLTQDYKSDHPRCVLQPAEMIPGWPLPLVLWRSLQMLRQIIMSLVATNHDAELRMHFCKRDRNHWFFNCRHSFRVREAFIKKKNKMTFVILGGGGGQKFSKCHLFKSRV